MPDKRKHRGPHPKDAELFSEDQLPALRTAVSELSWLLSHGYAIDSALKLVGDRHQLVARQRIAVRRSAASDQAVTDRSSREIELEAVGDILVLDGFNLIVTVEAALSGAVLLKCRDGAIRDLASVHGSYRTVEETLSAIQCIGRVLSIAPDLTVRWLLDSPVSNSGRLATLLRSYAFENGFRWDVNLVADPDKDLARADFTVVTSDSIVLDSGVRWTNLAERVVAALEVNPWVVNLRP